MVSLVTFQDTRRSRPRYEIDGCASACTLVPSDVVLAVYLLYKKDVKPAASRTILISLQNPSCH
jgi:hypothetical protein